MTTINTSGTANNATKVHHIRFTEPSKNLFEDPQARPTNTYRRPAVSEHTTRRPANQVHRTGTSGSTARVHSFDDFVARGQLASMSELDKAKAGKRHRVKNMAKDVASAMGKWAGTLKKREPKK
jgi:hypothetical protein